MFFKKPKGWHELSEEDRAWAKTLKKDNSAQKLMECARDNELTRLRYIFDNSDLYQLKNEHFQAAILAAVRKGSAAALKCIYQNTSWATRYFQTVIVKAVESKSVEILKFLYEECGKKDSAFFSKWEQNFGLFTAVSATGSKECWDIVCAGNAAVPEYLRISLPDIAANAVRNGFAEACDDVLGKKAAPGDIEVFELALREAAKKKPGAMVNVLQWRERFPGAKSVLDDLLCVVAGEGKIAHAEVLLGAGADASHGKGRALKAAASNGHREMAELLISKGADVQICADLVPALLNGADKQWEVGRYLDETFFGGRCMKIREEAEADKNFSLVDRDTLAEKKKLPSGGTLTILFNFSTRQQMVIAQDATAEKETMALQVTGFADIDHEALARAAEKFAALGGNPEITEGLKLRKPGLTRD